MSAPVRTVGKAVGERLSGGRPGRMQALGAALVVGVGTALATYKALRG
ncbi:MAG TPA: hypothetical protein VFN55_01550 [Solirubrobacteraceae bacterium]|nr:hypothetical protein [Solirubrobacteraceae bacterium]